MKKKVNLEGRQLSLKKSTVATLNNAQMTQIFGGEEPGGKTSKRRCVATRCDCPQSKISVCECPSS